MIFLITLISSCKHSVTQKNITDKPNNNQTGTIEKLDIIPGKRYTVKGLTKVYRAPQVFNSPEVVTWITNEQRIEVKELIDEYAKIDFRGEEGWILKWYLTNGEQEIKEIINKPYEKVIKNACYFYAAPDKTSIKGYEIQPGTAVHLLYEYADWYSIEFISEDKKYYGDKWVKKDVTADIDKLTNPFENKRETVKEALLQTCLQADRIEMASLGTGEVYAYIDGEKLGQFVELLGSGKIGAKPIVNSDDTHVRTELVISKGDKRQSIMLADTYILYFPTEAWLTNQDYLLFEDVTTFNRIKELFDDL